MILFIFEGKQYEPSLFEAIKSLFFPKREDQVLCSFCSSIYTFYKRLKDDFDGFADVVDVLKMEKKEVDPDNEILKYKSSDFESIYLFFDYDFYRGDLNKKNAEVIELLEYFKEETDYGKLFISYPMIESIQYTKELPDEQFHSYIVTRENSKGDIFKKDAKRFCYYRGYDFLKGETNWKHLIKQHVQKANMLVINELSWPKLKDDVEQDSVFRAQLEKYVDAIGSVAILNAFPLFLYYYFPIERFQTE